MFGVDDARFIAPVFGSRFSPAGVADNVPPVAPVVVNIVVPVAQKVPPLTVAVGLETVTVTSFDVAVEGLAHGSLLVITTFTFWPLVKVVDVKVEDVCPATATPSTIHW